MISYAIYPRFYEHISVMYLDFPMDLWGFGGGRDTIMIYVKADYTLFDTFLKNPRIAHTFVCPL